VVHLITLYERLAIKRSNVVIGTTSAVKEKFMRYGSKDIVTIMNCAEIREPPAESEVLALRKTLKTEGKKVVSYIGTLERIRGLEEMVDAFNAYNGDDIVLVLGGYGPTEKVLRAKSAGSKNIRYIGPVSPEKVPLYNHASDIMILLSNPENGQTQYCIANKIFEAMASGKPIIVTKGTLHQKIVEEVGSGIAIEYVDKKAMFEAFKLLASDNEIYSQMSQKGQKAAKHKYNWNEMAKRLLDLYDRL
jgi:glycosyltransferase involved in cell wall biosynthesis